MLKPWFSQAQSQVTINLYSIITGDLMVAHKANNWSKRLSDIVDVEKTQNLR